MVHPCEPGRWCNARWHKQQPPSVPAALPCMASSRKNWQAAVQGAEITLAQKGQMQLATTHAKMCAAQAVDLVHAAAGTTAIRNAYRFQQYFRDAHTMSQHGASAASRYASVGAVMLGMESDWGFFAF